GVALRAQQMHARPCSFARYSDRLGAGRADLVVRGHCELEDHVGTLVADAPEVPGMIMCRLCRARSDIDCYAGGAKPGMALPGHLRIGISNRRHHPGNARGDDGLSAGRRLAEM